MHSLRLPFKFLHKHVSSQRFTLRTAAESSSLKQMHFLFLITLTTQLHVNGISEETLP